MGALQEARSEAVGNASLLHDFIGHVTAGYVAGHNLMAQSVGPYFMASFALSAPRVPCPTQLLNDRVVIAVHTARAAPALCEAARLLISQARGSASRGRELQSQQLLAGRHGF